MPTSVQQMAVQSGWMTEKFLKHIVKNYSGTEFTLADLREDKVISAQLTAAVKKSAPKKPAAKKVAAKKAVKKSAPSDGFSPLAYLKENPDAPIEFSGTKGGKNAEVFERYKTATSYAEFVELAKSIRPDENPNGHITNDFKRGLLKIPRDSTPEPESPPQEKKGKKEKKAKKAKPEPQAELDEDTSDSSMPQQGIIASEADEDESVDSAGDEEPAEESAASAAAEESAGDESESDDSESDDDDDDAPSGFKGFAISADPDSDDDDDDDN